MVTAAGIADLALPWGLIGQDGEVAALARGVAAGRSAHAYLFAGPPRSGKGTLALRLAQALNCEERQPLAPDGIAPCLVCRSCRHIAAGKHADVEVVAPGGICAVSDHDHSKDNSKDIRICQIRGLEQRLSLTAFEGRYRVAILDPADLLNAVAADAFLKTLEEPPPGVVLLLLTAKDELLPETVRSRLRRVEVRPAPVDLLERLLAERGLEPIEAALVARLSRGCTGWALSAAADHSLLEKRARKLDAIVALSRPDAGLYARFAHAADLAARWTKDRAGVTETLNLWLEWWRDIVLGAGGAERGILNVDRLDQIHAAVARLRVAEAARFVQLLRETQSRLEENANARLALEVLMLRLPG